MMVGMTEAAPPPTTPEQQGQGGRSNLIKLGVSAVVVLAVVIGGAVAWSAYTASQKQVDIPAVEAEIREGMQDQLDVEVTVDCPDSIDWAGVDLPFVMFWVVALAGAVLASYLLHAWVERPAEKRLRPRGRVRVD